MTHYEKIVKSQCSIPFDIVLKHIIRELLPLPEIQALAQCNRLHQYEQCQAKIRALIKKKYPQLIQCKMPDYFAVLIALIHPQLEDFYDWKDIQFDRLNMRFPFVNQITYCACGQRVGANNSFVIGHKDSPLKLLVGCCCIEKNEIVFDFKRIKKERKHELIHLRIQQKRMELFPARRFFTIYKKQKQAENEHIKKWTDYNNELLRLHHARNHQQYNTWNNYNNELLRMHHARIQQQIDTWKNYNDKLMHMHRTRTHTSCQTCKKKVQCPYHICFGCRQTEYDKCSCGKAKQKKYPECYTCAKA